MKTVSFALIALLSILAAPLVADEPPAVDLALEEEITVTEVLLDVLVTDRRGNIVLGLGPDDFIVEEDGERVELTGVTFYSNLQFLESEERVADLGIDPDSVLDRRIFILLFHASRPMDEDRTALVAGQMQAADAARRWLDERLLPNDLVAVMSYDTTLRIQQDLTKDRASLRRALDEAMRGRGVTEVWPARLPDQEVSLVKHLPAGADLGRKTQRIYEALEVVAEAAANVHGRKNLVFLTPGLGVRDPGGQLLEGQPDFRDVVEALNSANVAVYTVPALGPAHRVSALDASHGLAEATGGRAFPVSGNLRGLLERIEEENHGYYLLSYRASHRMGESGFQEVAVRTVNPEFRVRARRGYSFGG